MYRLRHMKNEAGYTLFEAILQMVIFALFAQLFVLFFYWKVPIDRQYKNRAVVAWEIFAADFQDEITVVDAIEVIPSREGIRFKTKRGIITIEKRNDVIRKTVDGLGHVPLMTEVRKASFDLHDYLLKIEVIMKDGTRMERDFIVGSL